MLGSELSTQRYMNVGQFSSVPSSNSISDAEKTLSKLPILEQTPQHERIQSWVKLALGKSCAHQIGLPQVWFCARQSARVSVSTAVPLGVLRIQVPKVNGMRA